MMKLSSVTFPKSFAVGPDQRQKWLSTNHSVDIWIEGEFVWVQNGSAKALAHISQITHATVPSVVVDEKSTKKAAA